MTRPTARMKGGLTVIFVCAAAVAGLLSAACRSTGSEAPSTSAAARSAGRGEIRRTFRSERRVTIERPDHRTLETSESAPAAEPADPTAAKAKDRALAALDTRRGKAEAEEEEGREAVPKTAPPPASSPKETTAPAPGRSSPETVRETPAGGVAGAADAREGLSDWEQAFIEDMEGIVKAKKNRAALAEDDLAEHFPVSDEIQVGEAVAARILAGTPEYEDRALWEYVSFVGISLAERSSRSDLPFHFVVLDAPDDINAFAAPGGFVFITTGAIRFCRNEAELAAVLAHEIGHVVLRHGLRALDRGKYRVLAESAVSEMDAARERIFGRDSRPERLKKIEEALAGVADDCYAQTQAPYARAMEDEADRVSVKLLAAAGYAPSAALRLMERLAGLRKEGPAFTRALRSHPEPGERAAVLRKALRTPGLEDRGALCVERFRRFRERIR